MSKEFAKQFYSSQQWKMTRLLVLRRDLYTCQQCLANRASEVHHIIELTPDNINEISISLNPDNLISLCHECHTKITQGFTGDIQEGYVFDDEGNVVRV